MVFLVELLLALATSSFESGPIPVLFLILLTFVLVISLSWMISQKTAIQPTKLKTTVLIARVLKDNASIAVVLEQSSPTVKL